MGMRAQKVNKLSIGGNKRTCGVIAIAAVGIFFLCGIGTALYSVLGLGIKPTVDANQAMNNIYSTMTMEAAARAQIEQLTAQAPTPLPTEEPTLAVMPTSTFAPTQTSFPTKTPPPMILPTREPLVADSAACNCALIFECADFASHDAAQACFNSCGGNNWSGLDSEGDGVVCEELP
jgi:hypothetical protein